MIGSNISARRTNYKVLQNQLVQTTKTTARSTLNTKTNLLTRITIRIRITVPMFKRKNLVAPNK